MFDRLIDVLLEFIGLFQCWVYVDEFEKGVVLRAGEFHRTIDPGMRWIIPIAIEKVLVENSMPDPMYLDLQSLETADGYTCNIQIGIIWRITDIELFTIRNENTEDMVGMLCSGIVSRSVTASKWTDIRDPGYAGTLKAGMNRKVRKRGAEIDEIVVQDFAHGRADRLWHEGISLDMELD